MKVAIIKTIDTVESRMVLEPGNRVFISYNDSIAKHAFTLQSSARDENSMVYVFVTEPSSGRVNSTLILKLGNREPAMLITKEVKPVVVNGISFKGVECSPNGNSELSYMGTKRQNVKRPVVVGDVLKSSRREYRVEYIAQDGSLICRMYSRKDDNKYVGIAVIHQGELSLLKSLHESIEFAYA